MTPREIHERRRGSTCVSKRP